MRYKCADVHVASILGDASVRLVDYDQNLVNMSHHIVTGMWLQLQCSSVTWALRLQQKLRAHCNGSPFRRTTCLRNGLPSSGLASLCELASGQ